MEKILKSLKNYGLTNTILRILHRLRVISALHSFEITFKDLEELQNDRLNQPSENLKLMIREIQEYELTRLKFAPGMFAIETIKMHFSKGMRFFAAFLGDEIVAVNGAHLTCADLIYVGLPNIGLPAKVAYLNCAQTAPAYRNLFIGSQLRHFRLALLKKEGFEQAFGVVFIENRKALRWNLRNGSQYWGRISYIKLGNKKFWLKRLSPVGKRYAYILNGAKTEEKQELLEKIS